jgi:hypothetical protein
LRPRLWLLAAALALQGCMNLPASIREELQCAAPDHFGNAECQAELQWRGLPLRQAQIIVIERGTAQSFVMALLAEQYFPYTHAGLVVLDDGEPYVYESFAVLKPRLRGRPTRDAGGGVQRVPLASFLRRKGTIAIHDAPPGVDREAVVAFARARLAARTPFDEFFDARDAHAVYCTEFVARALEAGGAPPYPGIPVTANASARKLLDWLEVRAPRLLLAGEVLRDTRRRVLIDQWHTREQIDSLAARRRELHRRFTRDQRLGNVVRFGGWSLQWQPQLARYLDVQTAEEDAVALAARLLGVAPAKAATASLGAR